MVIENVISDDIGVSEVFNEYFVNIVPNLKITELIIDENFTETADKLSDSINKFRNHQSIMIKTKIVAQIYFLSLKLRMIMCYKKLIAWVLRKHNNKLIFQLKF